LLRCSAGTLRADPVGSNLAAQSATSPASQV
jgi:hypothetical protein